MNPPINFEHREYDLACSITALDGDGDKPPFGIERLGVVAGIGQGGAAVPLQKSSSAKVSDDRRP